MTIPERLLIAYASERVRKWRTWLVAGQFLSDQ